MARVMVKKKKAALRSVSCATVCISFAETVIAHFYVSVFQILWSSIHFR